MADMKKDLWTDYNGKGFSAEYSHYSERARADVNDNDITLTIADSKVSQIGGKDISAAIATTAASATSATQDASGNVITDTYASKSYVDSVADGLETALDTLNDTMESVAHAGMHDLGKKTESDLNNGKLAIGCGNSNTELTLTTVSTLTVLANSGVPNFALLVDNSGNSNAVTVTVKDSTDENPLLQSTAAGNKVSAGKICQITCVGKCWTLAEFGTANA
jgi:hypothetical protein